MAARNRGNWTRTWGTRSPKRECHVTGKTMFDKRGAQTARNRRFEEARVELRIYQCHYCKGWHLTSNLR